MKDVPMLGRGTIRRQPLTAEGLALLTRHGIKPRREHVTGGEFKRLADAMGIRIEDEKVGDDIHGSGLETYGDEKQCYNSFVNEMAQGFEPCEDADCEVCGRDTP